MSSSHSNLLKITLLNLSQAKVATAWRVETGVAKSMDASRIISFGLKGCPDIVGLTPDGKFLAVEIKIGKDKLRPEQVAFKMMVLKNKGHYFIVKELNDIEEMINELTTR
jgi:hypothetical protein